MSIEPKQNTLLDTFRLESLLTLSFEFITGSKFYKYNMVQYFGQKSIRLKF